MSNWIEFHDTRSVKRKKLIVPDMNMDNPPPGIQKTRFVSCKQCGFLIDTLVNIKLDVIPQEAKYNKIYTLG